MEPAVIPHDKDLEEKPSKKEPTNTKNPLPQVSKTTRLPDGTEVEQKIQDIKLK